MSTEMETRARLLYDECVRLLSDREPRDAKLVESATGGKVTADATTDNGLEYCKVIVSVLDHIVIGQSPAATPKRRGRPKGSKNKPRGKVTAGPKKSVAEAQTRSGRDVTGQEKKPAKKRGRPKDSKNKPQDETAAE